MWAFSSQQATLRRLNKAFARFFGRVKTAKPGVKAGYPRFKGNVRFDSVEWPRDGDGARWLPEQRRVYLQGVGQVKVGAHRPVLGRVKTIRIKRCGRRWMLVLSCDDVPAMALPATGRQAGVDVGIVRYATLSDGTAIDNPRWARAACDRLTVAQQRLQGARRGSKNRQAKRETVAARHRKIANQRKDFHHKLGQTSARPRQPRPVPRQRAPGPSPGFHEVSVTLAGASSSQYCAPKRKTLGAP